MHEHTAIGRWIETEMLRTKMSDQDMHDQTGLAREDIKEIRKGQKIPSPKELSCLFRGLPRLKRQGGLLSSTRMLFQEMDVAEKENKNKKPAIALEISGPDKTKTPKVESLGESSISPIKINTNSNEQYTRIETIDPALATLLLSANVRNRRISAHHVDTLARAIQNGDWIVTHQGIALDKDARLLDGQHRLSAIVQANKTVDMVVTYNASPESFHVVDTSLMPRTSLQVLNMAEQSGESMLKYQKPSSHAIAGGKVLHTLVTGVKVHKWSVAETVANLEKYPGLAAVVCRLKTYRRAGIVAGMGYVHEIYPDIVEKFIAKVNSLVEMNAIHSAFVKATERVNPGEAGNIDLALISMRAIRLVSKGETSIRSLYIKLDEKQLANENVDFKHFRHMREKAGLAT